MQGGIRRSLLTAAAALAWGGSSLEGCGARTPLPLFESDGCEPGEARACTGPSGCPGIERCLPDAGAFSSCECEADAGPECFEQTYSAKGSPVSLHFIVDRSGSMITFWDATIQALSDFFTDRKSAGLTVALDFFPALASEEDQCLIETYSTPDVPFGLLTDRPSDDQEARLVSELRGSYPDGGTPMYPAYAGALDVAVARARGAGVNETVVVVLVTDGEPTGCESINSKIQIVRLAEEAVSESPPVRTFTIGLEGADEVLVDAVAEKGNGQSFFIGAEDVARELVASFERIRRKLGCDYQLVGVPYISPDDVAVTYAPSNGGDVVLPYDPSCTRGGFTLDTSTATPVISLCEDRCDSIQSDERGSLRIKAGCAKVVGTGGAGGAGGAAGAGGAGGSGGGASSDVLGSACDGDSDCGDDLFCLTEGGAGAGGGGPANGLCTTTCAKDSDCEALDALARCETIGAGSGLRVCAEGCQVGPRGLMTFNPKKCHGRPEVACSPLGDSQVETSCLPQCNDDSDCGPGLFCHPKDGLCRSEPAPGLPVGSPCTSDADCRGTCVLLAAAGGGTTPTCTEWCTDSALPACGWNGPGTGPADGFCIFGLTPVFLGGGPGHGDLGACGQLCNTDGECRNPDLACADLGNAQFTASTGKKGVCSDPFQMGLPVPGT